MKRAFLVLFVGFLMLALTVSATDLGFKIGVVTSTVSQSEDEYRGGEAVVALYGDDVIHVTYPDNFMQEQETTISQIVNLAHDSEVKAIVVAQAVPGTVPAIRKIREFRDDIVFVVVSPHEDPWIVSEEVDAALDQDQLSRGRTIVEVAHSMGAKVFLHYSFPRHMSYELLAQRRDLMKDTCDELGMEFVFVTAPDPMGEQGISGTQQFMMEDIPRQIEVYGKDTNIFGTNCAMMEQIITQVINTGAIFAEQCCPAPTHGYPGALGLAITDDMKGDMDKIVEAIDEKVRELGAGGRLATWPVAFNLEMTKAAAALAIEMIQNGLNSDDMDAVLEVVEKSADAEMRINRLDEDGNYYLLTSSSVIFGE
ncbi:MAG: DUF3798 domain-containing protein [Thermotogota bacterium]